MSEIDKQAVADAWASMGPFGVCQRLGLKFKREHGRAMICCPWHSDKTPSCSVDIGKTGTVRVHCFSCNETWDIFALVGVCYGIDPRRDFAEVLDRAADLVGMSGSNVVELPMRQAQPSQPDREYASQDDLDRFLAACVRVDASKGVHDWLVMRGIDPLAVSVRDLAYALPTTAQLPAWAKYGGKTWIETSHRLIVPMYDHRGEARSVRAGRIVESDSPKRLPPAGLRSTGLVMLDTLGREAFKAGGWPKWNTKKPRFLVCEGEPAFLTWASHVPINQGPPRYAVIGIVSGSWCDAIAASIPNGADVAVWTDADEAGERYAKHVRESLRGRCDVIRRTVEEIR